MKHLISLAIVAVICSTIFTHAMNRDIDSGNNNNLGPYSEWLTHLENQFIIEKPFYKIGAPISCLFNIIIKKTISPAHRDLWSQQYPYIWAAAKTQKAGLKHVFNDWMQAPTPTEQIDQEKLVETQKQVARNLQLIYVNLEHLKTCNNQINNLVFH